jgi:hypothetical protein
MKNEFDVWIENQVTSIMIMLRLELNQYHLGETEYDELMRKIRKILYDNRPYDT